jgi:hypothetical protein
MESCLTICFYAYINGNCRVSLIDSINGCVRYCWNIGQ